MAGSLQHRQAAQRFGLSSASTQKHRADGPETNDALTIKPDHPMGARQEAEEVKRNRLAAGELGLDIYNMRARLAEKGLKYV